MCVTQPVCVRWLVTTKWGLTVWLSECSFTQCSYSSRWCTEHFIHVKAMRKVSYNSSSLRNISWLLPLPFSSCTFTSHISLPPYPYCARYVRYVNSWRISWTSRSLHWFHVEQNGTSSGSASVALTSTRQPDWRWVSIENKYHLWWKPSNLELWTKDTSISTTPFLPNAMLI